MQNKKTLLIFASTYPRWTGDHEPGFVHELAKRLTQQFHVIVLCPHAKEALHTEIMDGVEVIRYRYAPERIETLVNDGGIVSNLKKFRWKILLVPNFVLLQALQAWRLCRSRKIDVIHAHWLIPQGLIAAALQLLPGKKVPFVVTSHGADLYALRSRPLVALKRWVIKRASAATVVSSAMLNEIEKIGTRSEKISVLPMGVDFADRFVPGDPQKRSTNELLFVGRLVEKKGLRYLIDAMPLILKRHPNVQLIVAGFGPEEYALKEQVERLALKNSVQFLGAVIQADLPKLYQRATLFIAPFVESMSGDQEGLGLVVVEAIACGCPVLVSSLPAVLDVLDPIDDAHCLTPPGNVTKLADRIEYFLEHPTYGVDQVRRLRILNRLDWQFIASNYADILHESLINGYEN